jgi:bifunctional non-homologous end joining protein LigD
VPPPTPSSKTKAPKKKAAAAAAKPKRAAAAKPRTKGTPLSMEFGDVTVLCSNVDRVMFPDSGITKRDVLEYYRDVADVMVPHVRGRALTIERFTKGIDGGGFFQKHFQKHYPDWIDSVEMGTKTRVTYPIANDPASLVYFANQGGIAMHVGTSQKESLDRPDQIVFDLDPPEGNFEIAVQAAHAVRGLMDDLELPTFLKTSGSKGLHVIVPIDGTSNEDVALFCKRCAAHLCKRHPDIVTTEFSKKERGGRLYLDTQRNPVGATVVAPYSLRGKPGAPASAPISWDELDDPDLRANTYGLRNLRERLDEHGDPWADLHASSASIANALAELAD